MSGWDDMRRVFFCGCASLALLLANAALAQPSSPDEAAKLIKQARDLQTSDVAQFSAILQRLDSDSMNLSPEQKLQVRYLNAFQVAYKGDNKTAIVLLDQVANQSADPALRLRALSTEVNVLTQSTRIQDAYTKFNDLLDTLPYVTDKQARLQALGVASLLFTDAGQYELGVTYADRMLKEDASVGNVCRASYARLWALYKSGMHENISPQFEEGINTCVIAKEPIFANFIRSFVADDEIQHRQYKVAIKLLEANFAAVVDTHYRRLISDFNSLMAQAYWEDGDTTRAGQFAISAVASAVKNEYTQPLTRAYRLLYQVEKQQGDFASALRYYEKYAEADKGYLDDVSAKVLAYQTVKQQVLAKKQQIDALDKQNHILLLQRALDKKARETTRLYLILLLIVLALIAFVAYRLKRSQLRFMRMARRDGLTGLFNRQHFLDEAPRQLGYCKKSSRDACVVLIDLDHFKNINDTHGHVVGDEVLKRAVTACQAHLRSTDIFGRLGGEEFGILLPECSLEQVTERVEKLRLAVAKSPVDDATGVSVSASFGVATTTISGYELRQLLIHADDALYQAKNSGRNRVVVFEDVANSREAGMRKSRVGTPRMESMD
jgi:diguanylate cyclase (GGDEF)-like protein